VKKAQRIGKHKARHRRAQRQRKLQECIEDDPLTLRLLQAIVVAKANPLEQARAQTAWDAGDAVNEIMIQPSGWNILRASLGLPKTGEPLSPKYVDVLRQQLEADRRGQK
jgi:hypothetical protein